ncbi:hypothetical protein Q8A73_018134 [Channa argus]|nr:hypothetical protein Q8A73_018134 [Channa argus]
MDVKQKDDRKMMSGTELKREIWAHDEKEIEDLGMIQAEIRDEWGESKDITVGSNYGSDETMDRRENGCSNDWYVTGADEENMGEWKTRGVAALTSASLHVHRCVYFHTNDLNLIKATVQQRLLELNPPFCSCFHPNVIIDGPMRTLSVRISTETKHSTCRPTASEDPVAPGNLQRHAAVLTAPSGQNRFDWFFWKHVCTLPIRFMFRCTLQWFLIVLQSCMAADEHARCGRILQFVCIQIKLLNLLRIEPLSYEATAVAGSTPAPPVSPRGTLSFGVRPRSALSGPSSTLQWVVDGLLDPLLHMRKLVFLGSS